MFKDINIDLDMLLGFDLGDAYLHVMAGIRRRVLHKHALRLVSSFRKLNYCDYIKCGRQTSGYGCSIAMSGEDCWTLYSHVQEEEGPMLKFQMYEFYLEEQKMNSQLFKEVKQ